MQRFWVVCLLFAPLVLGQPGYNLLDFGLNAPSDSSCPSSGSNFPGWFIDREYDSACFPRQVYCDAAGSLNASYSWRVCDSLTEVFVSDGSDTCESATDSSCGLFVTCDADSIDVRIMDSAVWNQNNAAMQFGSDSITSNTDDCVFGHSSGMWSGSLSLLQDSTGTDGSWRDCGVRRDFIQDQSGGDGYALHYWVDVKRFTGRGSGDYREEETHGATVTREKCFMMTAHCYYNTDGTVTSAFQPSSPNTLDESDDSELTFDLVPTTCEATNTDRSEQSIQTVFVNDDVCFRAKITSTWHSNIRLSVRKCWASATSGASTSAADAYYLASRNGDWTGNTDSTFNWDCYNGAYQEDFSFTAFRYQESSNPNDPDYTQTIYVMCEVNACDVSDTSSDDCTTSCTVPGANRQRRAASEMSIAKLTKSNIMTKSIVLPQINTLRDDEAKTGLFAQFGGPLTVGLAVVGCILAAVAAFMLVTLKKLQNKNNQVLYSTMPQHAKF